MLFPFYCFGAVYYVDYTNSETTSADTELGTSTGAAWIHCPGDPRATDNADITLAAGDTVVFKGGVTYSFTNGGDADYIAANNSGTSGNVITYISGHVYGTPWGTGRAVIDGTYADLAWTSQPGVFNLKNYSYITVQGLEIENYPTYGGYWALLSWVGTTGGNIIIDNNFIHNSADNGILLLLSGDDTAPTNFDITNNTITLTNGHGIIVRGGFDDILIENNSFDLNGVIVYAGETSAGNNIAFAGDWDDSSVSCTNLIVRGNDMGDSAEDNPSYTPTKSHILMFQELTDPIFEDNYFHGKPQYSSIDIAMKSGINGWIIRNNVFHDQTAVWQGQIVFNGANGANGTFDGIKIYNNTFVSYPGGIGQAGILSFRKGTNTTSPQIVNLDIRNNIFDLDTDTTHPLIYIETDDSAVPVVQLSTLTINNNAYQTGKADDYFHSDGSTYNLAGWRIYLSGENATGADADSNFGQVTFTDEAGDDFTLDSSDTVAINEGTTLTGYTDDKDGETRVVPWDIGAYEYEAAAPANAIQGVSITP